MLLILVVGAAIANVVVVRPAVAAGVEQVGEWRFDESGQTVLDTGAHGLHGQLGASLLADAADPTRGAGLRGGALHFDGTSFVRLPDRPEFDVQAVTVEAVVRAPTSPGPWRYVVSRGGRDCFSGSYGLYSGEAGGIAVYVFDGARYAVSATARPADVWNGSWHHVAGVFDGRSLHLLVDGRPVGDPVAWMRPVDYTRTSAGVFLGRFAGSCDLAFRGDVDLVRISSGAISSSALAEAASRELDPSGRGSPLPAAGLPLPAAAAPTIIDGGALAPDESDPAPDQSSQRCELRVSRPRVAARRRTTVRVRAKSGGAPLRATRVVARRPGRRHVLASARTGKRGWARLVFDSRGLRRVRISAPRTSRCAAVHLRVSPAARS